MNRNELLDAIILNACELGELSDSAIKYRRWERGKGEQPSEEEMFKKQIYWNRRRLQEELLERLND